MAKDPAFLFYPGDASEDTQFLNRLERGCYFDLLKAQKKFGKFSLDQIKKVLGNDFESCWESLKICLTCVEDMYFIGWANDSIEKRKEFSESRRNNRKGKKQTNEPTHVEDMCNISERHVEDMVNEIENVNEDIITKEIIIKKNELKIKIRENVFLKEAEIVTLQRKYTHEDLEWMFDKLSANKIKTGQEYKSDYGAVLSWVVEALNEFKLKQKKQNENANNQKRGTEVVEGQKQYGTL